MLGLGQVDLGFLVSAYLPPFPHHSIRNEVLISTDHELGHLLCGIFIMESHRGLNVRNFIPDHVNLKKCGFVYLSEF